jgi:Cu/Ag efflux protein CusF
MLRGRIKISSVIAALLAVAAAVAQTTPAANRAQLSGTVSAVNADSKQITLKSDKGEDVAVTTTDHTLILRIPPGETDPKKGTKTALNTLSAGDRAVIIGPTPTDPKAWTATAVLVMSKSDVASLQQKDQEDWKKRGTTGTVTAVDPAAKTVTIKSGPRTFTVQASGKTIYHRYSPDSARFSDAKPSNFAEIKTGDQVRVLGNKSDDTAIQAERIVSGSFRQIAATITAINPETGELTVKDLATKKPLSIKVNADSTMRKLPEMVARQLARRYSPGAQEGDGDPAAGRGGMTGAGTGAGRGGGRGADVPQMLDSLPAMPLSELKPGDAIMVSTTQGSDPGRVTAIMLLAGVEPLLTASPTATRDIMSGWNLGGGGGDPGQQ